MNAKYNISARTGGFKGKLPYTQGPVRQCHACTWPWGGRIKKVANNTDRSAPPHKAQDRPATHPHPACFTQRASTSRVMLSVGTGVRIENLRLTPILQITLGDEHRLRTSLSKCKPMACAALPNLQHHRVLCTNTVQKRTRVHHAPRRRWTPICPCFTEVRSPKQGPAARL